MPALSGQDTALGSALKVTLLNEKRLMDFFKSIGFFTYGDCHSA
jgi:hypothetical protein